MYDVWPLTRYFQYFSYMWDVASSMLNVNKINHTILPLINFALSVMRKGKFWEFCETDASPTSTHSPVHHYPVIGVAYYWN